MATGGRIQCAISPGAPRDRTLTRQSQHLQPLTRILWLAALDPCILGIPQSNQSWPAEPIPRPALHGRQWVTTNSRCSGVAPWLNSCICHDNFRQGSGCCGAGAGAGARYWSLDPTDATVLRHFLPIEKFQIQYLAPWRAGGESRSRAISHSRLNAWKPFHASQNPLRFHQLLTPFIGPERLVWNGTVIHATRLGGVFFGLCRQVTYE